MESLDFVIGPAPFCHGFFDFVMEAVQNQDRNFLDLSFFSSFFSRKGRERIIIMTKMTK